MRTANQQNHFPSPTPKVRIYLRNFLSLEESDSHADLIVTSPPYVTSYDYASMHQLSTMWLNYGTDYRILRKNMLGNQYGVKAPNLGTLRGTWAGCRGNLFEVT